ncbi:DUF732 domain-containing protein [Mycobacterium sp. CSUR Q5927]|nr:DUF732 domain-containing protein [Mycobacterium sp. CSUR Q5927]
MRIAKAIGTGLIAAGVAVGTAGVASADDAGYLSDLNSHGMTYGAPVVGIASPASALRAGNDICANIRYSGNPRAGFNMLTNASIPDYMIEAAQRNLCPDTLGA